MKLSSLNPRLRNSIPNRLIKKITRDFVHSLNPNGKFKRLLLAQKNSFDKPSYTLSFDLDFYADYEEIGSILDLLKTFEIRAVFAVIGKFVELYPDVHRRMVEEGHELVNHTYSHPDNPHWAPNRFFNLLSSKEQKEEILGCHEAVNRHTGVEMIGYRSPHFGNLHTDNVYPILKDLGYRYSSSLSLQYSKSSGEPYIHKSDILEFPVAGSVNFPLAVFDSWNARRKSRPFFETDQEFVNEFDSTMASLAETGGYMTHYFDPYDLDENKFRLMLNSIKNHHVQTVTYSMCCE